MRMFKPLILCVAVSLATVAGASADVQLSIANGRVSLIARDVTVRQILTEWARIGQTRVVNVERVPNGLVTLEFRNVPEQQALDTLLRSVSGYVAAPRADVVANASMFDRIVVMPASAPPPAAAARPAANPTYQQPPPGMFVPPGMQAPPVADDDEDEAPAPPVNRGPVFNAYPAPQVTNPQQQLIYQPTPGVAAPVPIVLPQQEGAPVAPGYQPAIPFGGSVPGMVVPQPQPPGGNQPNQPAQPRRPGRGPGDRDPEGRS